jgi:16S rRNA (cytosine1402-N4)-methyltransferase
MSQKNDLNAYKVVNEYETNLKQVFLTMESWKCPVFGRTIVEAREQLIKTTDELKEVLARYLPDR